MNVIAGAVNTVFTVISLMEATVSTRVTVQHGAVVRTVHLRHGRWPSRSRDRLCSLCLSCLPSHLVYICVPTLHLPLFASLTSQRGNILYAYLSYIT